ncbi:MAG TPA: thioredoxin domain-containing protein [Gaiellaceae bacterium]|nr:thioredoxin domain-containing protein [Gaiellaceae bacterium]
MPSGKRARQQRREAAVAAPPPVRSKGAGGTRARQASPRVLAIVGGVVLVAVVAIVLGVVLSSNGGGGSSGGGSVVSASDMSGLPKVGNANWSGQLDGAADANALFNGIPQTGLVLGKPTAPVEMEMFIDVQCPFCQDYEVNNLPTVVKDDIKSGKVQLHLQPWAFIGGAGSQSFSGRLGLIAASFQNKGYEYAKVLYDNQGTEDTGWLTGRQMALIAASVNGLNLKKWQQSANGSAVKQIASRVDRLAAKAKVQGTPTVLVGCAGNTLQNVTSPQLEPTLEQTQNAIAAASCSK